MGNKVSKSKGKDLTVIYGYLKQQHLGNKLTFDIVWTISHYYSIEDGYPIANKHLYINGANIFPRHCDGFEDGNHNLYTQYGGCVLAAAIDTNYRGEWCWKFRMDEPQYDYEYDYQGYCAVQILDDKFIHNGDKFKSYCGSPEDIPDMWKQLTPAYTEENIIFHEYTEFFTIKIVSSTSENYMILSGNLEDEEEEEYLKYTHFHGQRLKVVVKPRICELFLLQFTKKNW